MKLAHGTLARSAAAPLEQQRIAYARPSVVLLRMSPAIAALVGAGISAVVAILVVGLQHVSHRRQERERATSERLAALSGTAWSITVAIGRLARADSADKPTLADEVDLFAEPFNMALARIELLDNERVVRAAFALDKSLIELRDQARERVWSNPEWRASRHGVSDAVVRFLREARAEVGSPPIEFDFLQ
ncbi:hypothetical protein [Miltoncostaea oceani]|uniref:hypothetical protein n=1 Tax=Miltoncostaea oceani TaxID=2843216 RepID=UPI001C3CE342|nr:hypothetical protein [Miltoncostaea oceani]